jgi:hypothetical protein
MLYTINGPITDQRLIQQNVYDLYCELLGTTATSGCGLAPNTWLGRQRVSQEENNLLALTFSEEELDVILKDMKTNTAPGLDGLPVIFYKTLCPLVKRGILHILNDFVLGCINIARLNFGILSLKPKVPGADQITQYRPIALINIIFKIVAKAYTARLDPVDKRLISSNQTTFIKGRNILDGPLALIEIIYELKKQDLGGIVMGQQRDEQVRITNKLNCKLGAFPFIYLGLPISDRKLTLEQWFFLVRKLAVKFEPWLGKLLSSGGRLILFNACLENLLMFAIGLFLLHDGIHTRFDSHRSKFYWDGAGPKCKYHMVNWPTVCRPKEVGGLGLLNTKKMNLALLLKWVWRIYQEEDNIWAKLIRAKYQDADDIFSGSGQGGS